MYIINGINQSNNKKTMIKGYTAFIKRQLININLHLIFAYLQPRSNLNCQQMCLATHRLATHRLAMAKLPKLTLIHSGILVLLFKCSYSAYQLFSWLTQKCVINNNYKKTLCFSNFLYLLKFAALLTIGQKCFSLINAMQINVQYDMQRRTSSLWIWICPTMLLLSIKLCLSP